MVNLFIHSLIKKKFLEHLDCFLLLSRSCVSDEETNLNFNFSGDCPNLSKASKKFGINKGTLQKLMRSGQSYQGSGSCSKIFTKDEEKLIAVRY